MRKIITAALCAVMTFAAVGATACRPEVYEDSVNLVAITGAEIGVRDDIDYYVAPEPAASTRAGAVAGLDFSGDLQALYGGEKGYPQAVVVIKNSLLGYDVAEKFVDGLRTNTDWLSAESTSAETVANAVQAHLTDGLSPAFNAKNLTKQVISNCGIRFTDAAADKDEIKTFMQKLNGVAQTSFGEPTDGFFFDGNFSQNAYTGNLTVCAPDGAPALGIANFLAGEATVGGAETQFNVVDPARIQQFVTNNNDAANADICILPVNLAVRLLGNGERYSLLGTLTHGNLYMLSKNGAQITSANLESLCGKTVGVVNLAAVPGLTFKLILKNNGIEYAETV